MCPPPQPPNPEPDEEADEAVVVQVDEMLNAATAATFAALFDPADVAQAVTLALAAEGHPEGQATVVITDDAAVQELNRQFRGVDEATDVLSFPSQDDAPGFVSAPEANTYLGDILIALPFTQRQAERLGRSLRDELRLLAVHGVLHLLGYDHAEAEEEAAMWARQDAILAQLAA